VLVSVLTSTCNSNSNNSSSSSNETGGFQHCQMEHAGWTRSYFGRASTATTRSSTRLLEDALSLLSASSRHGCRRCAPVIGSPSRVSSSAQHNTHPPLPDAAKRATNACAPIPTYPSCRVHAAWWRQYTARHDLQTGRLADMSSTELYTQRIMRAHAGGPQRLCSISAPLQPCITLQPASNASSHLISSLQQQLMNCPLGPPEHTGNPLSRSRQHTRPLVLIDSPRLFRFCCLFGVPPPVRLSLPPAVLAAPPSSPPFAYRLDTTTLCMHVCKVDQRTYSTPPSTSILHSQTHYSHCIMVASRPRDVTASQWTSWWAACLHACHLLRVDRPGAPRCHCAKTCA
jgi:hypothetical protein